jgi:single-strand DNA-binding protein
MNSQTTVIGLVATTPRHLVTETKLPITSFRIAASFSKWNEDKKRFVDAETNWFTVTAFADLAVNAANSISKGDRIVVVGDLRVRDWDNGERAGTSVEIEAVTIGHDLSRGVSTYTRTDFVAVEESEDN